MNKAQIGLLVATAGVLLVLVSTTAELTGLGHAVDFGWKQMSGTAAGILAILGGLILWKQSS